MNKKGSEYTSKVPRRAINMEEMLMAPSVHQPQPFENRSLLYLMHFFFAFVSGMWDMGTILLVAELTNNSLFLVAIMGLCSGVAVFLFMGLIGNFLDRTNRIVAVRIALVINVLAVSITYSICAYLNLTSTADQVEPAENILHDPVKRSLLYSLPLWAAVAGLACCAINQSIEKDWIVVLSAKDTRWLSGTNSVMTQIDLGCSSLAPALTGVLFAYQSHAAVSLTLLCINAVAVLALYVFMNHLYHAWPALGQKVGVDVLEATDNLNFADLESLIDSEDDDLNDTPAAYGSIGKDTNTRREQKSRLSVRSAAEQTALLSRRVSTEAMRINKQPQTLAPAPTSASGQIKLYFLSTLSTFNDFIASGCAGMMVSYAFLYMTVLCFGSLMTVYIRFCGVEDDLIGLFRGLSALFGYLGAVIFPVCSELLGLHNAAQVAIIYQFALVAVAASSFFWTRDATSVYVVIFAVLFSRTGLWLFDLCVRQIAQETIPEAVRGKVNGQWRSIIAFFEMSSYGLAAAISAPENFWILAVASGAMVGLALLLFSLTNPHRPCQRISNNSNNSNNSSDGREESPDREGRGQRRIASNVNGKGSAGSGGAGAVNRVPSTAGTQSTSTAVAATTTVTAKAGATAAQGLAPHTSAPAGRSVAGSGSAAAPLQESRISPSSEDEYVVVPSTSGKHQAQTQQQKLRLGGDNEWQNVPKPASKAHK